MLDHPIFGTALGLIVFFAVFSILVSAVQECVSSALRLRSRDLWRGLVNLLGEQEAKKAYEHPLIKSLAKSGAMPSYIDTRTLSTAVLDNTTVEVLGKAFASTSGDDIALLAKEIPDNHPLKTLVQSMARNTEDAANDLHRHLSEWFDEGMERISGWYKRRSQIMVFVIAGIVTVSFNASTIEIATKLWANDNLRSTISADASMTVSEYREHASLGDSGMQAITQFPIGWRQEDLATIGSAVSFLSLTLSDQESSEQTFNGQAAEDMTQWLPRHIAGWALTVVAVSLGAPFWFDLLGRVANVRGTGPKTSGPSGQSA